MFLAYQLGAYYLDLHHPKFASALALVHQRFRPTPSHRGSSRTPTAWSPITANQHAARQPELDGGAPGERLSPLFGKNISRLWPISYEGQSDTACFDNALEFLVQGGYSLAHAAMMLIPEAWAGNPLMDAKRRAFYEYHACSWSRGTGRPPWPSPTAARSAPHSTATVCALPATS